MRSHSSATLSAAGALVTWLEAATLLGCAAYRLGYPRPRKGLQRDPWDHWTRRPFRKMAGVGMEKRSKGQVLSPDVLYGSEVHSKWQGQ